MEKKVYIWGTGRLASIALGERIKEETVMGFIDNNAAKKSFRGKTVFQPDDMLNKEYDAIIVINLYSKEIYEQSKALGLDLRKMIFLHNSFMAQDLNANYELVQELFGREYRDILSRRCVLVRRNEAVELEGRILESGYSDTDYVRIKTFELVAEQVKQNKIEGSVAEVGVFRGEFAQYINAAFPDRKCYLFDTFEGFDETEAEEEIERGHTGEAMVSVYKDTSVDVVMKKMRHPEMVEIRKGLFPETLNGLDEPFAFVSIDVDFEKSMYDCLEYFYPRVARGGIFSSMTITAA